LESEMFVAIVRHKKTKIFYIILSLK
jgi:hypothetical protein